MKTREEVEKLKQNWLNDTCWDIYGTEGFEDYKDELRIYQKNCEDRWKAAKEKHHDFLASKTCPMKLNNSSGSFGWNCEVEKCAWWNNEKEKCGAILYE
ncbi:MAG: hypothetical protein WC389_11815 [Lutibacter sp.]|jgi:hypothetical protein